MCRWRNEFNTAVGSGLGYLILIVSGWLFPAAPAVAEEVDLWLEKRGFTRLLVEHLESKLPSMDADDRGPVMVRLAQLYAELLSETEDRAIRISLEERARRLLEEVRGADAQSLELELCHGAYLGIEQVAEKHRLRLIDDTQQIDLVDRLEELIGQLRKLGARVDKLIEYSGRGLERVASRIHKGRTKQDVLLEMSNRINFLLGWCLYYQAWMSQDVGRAEQAERYFAKVLSLDSLNPGDVSMDLRSSAAIGWAIIGMSLVNQIVASDTSAMSWLDLLEEPIVPQEIRSQIPGFRLAILLESKRFDKAESFLGSLVDGDSDKSVIWIRMAAVHALDGGDSPEARSLASMSLAALASLGELAQLQDIVSRYPESIRGDSFPFAYARAILDHRQAMEMQDAAGVDEMTRREAWMNARKSVQLALEAEDVGRFEQARQQASLLHAWSLYHLGQYGQASEMFESVSEHLAEKDSSEALWMAFVSEERTLQLDGNAPRSRADSLAKSYLLRFPNGPRAGELKVRSASREQQPSDERVAELLAVPISSPARSRAESQASVMLYELFRSSPDYQKKDRAARYLAVAVPIMQRQYSSEDDSEVSQGVARARRVLEVSTNPNVLRLVAADNAIEILTDDKVESLEQARLLLDEIAYRRVLMLIARSRLDDAIAQADELHGRSPDSVWSRLSSRRLLEQAMEANRIAESTADASSHRLLVQLGLRVLSEDGPLEEVLADASSRSLASIVGSSASIISRMQDVSEAERVEMLELAWGIFDVMLEAEPRNESFLTSRARLASDRGDDDESLRCWRIIAAGSPAGSPPWFEARTELLLILEENEPVRAAKVLEQHVVLYPDYGPPPWGDALRALDERLRSAAGSLDQGDSR